MIFTDEYYRLSNLNEELWERIEEIDDILSKPEEYSYTPKELKELHIEQFRFFVKLCCIRIQH